jgi:uncharacterized protein YbbC (DUF1343 family)
MDHEGIRMAKVATGLDRASREGLRLPGRGRVAVLCNATTVSAAWLPSVDALLATPGMTILRILSPQHGFASEKQDNMVESSDGVHPRLGIPIHSLYHDVREPRPEVLTGLDAVLVDLQDVGTRVYTFATTALLTIAAAHRAGVPVIVLDRPNPIGGIVEGPVLEDGFRSFVGHIDVPLRHGLTIGELCLYGAWRLGILDGEAVRALDGRHSTEDIDLGPVRVIPLEGWRRSMYLDETGLPWTVPSPNLPTLGTAVVYPGQVALEGTNLSEGRGTTRPFEFFGAPYLDPGAVAAELARTDTPDLTGVVLREIHYEPTFHKFAGQLVRGFHVHVIDRHGYRPVRTFVALLAAIRRVHADAFAWRQPPYEYEWHRLAIDLIFGTDRVRAALEAGVGPDEIAASWDAGCQAFRERVRPFRLYEE